MRRKQVIILILIFLSCLLVDQLTKFWIASNMNIGESITVISSFFYITFVKNTGAAWSIFEGKMVFFYIMTLLAILLLGYYLRNTKSHQTLTQIAIVLMLAGTFGNFIDRLAFQYVRDFFDFYIFGYNFPVFNIADMCLTIGVVLLLLDEFLKGVGKKV